MPVQVIIIIGVEKGIFSEIKVPVFDGTGPSRIKKVQLGNSQCIHVNKILFLMRLIKKIVINFICLFY